MSSTSATGIDLKPVQALLPKSFFVPKYQRGYRWTPIQVSELLDDLLQFQRSHHKPEEFYCLQPVVVKALGEDNWELVDGQQRLTTIHILLQNLRNSLLQVAAQPFGLTYATRPGSRAFLQQIDKAQRHQNIDFYHMVGALEAIESWFVEQQKRGEDPGLLAMDLYRTLLTRTKVIWYELGAEESGHAVFARINSGKIPLTNAELVKALFLRKAKEVAGGQSNSDTQYLQRQVEIAKEWDAMEARLQQPDFWYFLNQGTNEPATRIDLLFTILADVKVSKDSYDTFRDYQVKLDQASGERILEEWQKVRELFLLLEDWFRNREWYHRIGFLVSVGEPLGELVNQAGKLNKPEFRAYLQDRIRRRVAGNWDELTYGGSNELLKNVLLLFNVETIQASQLEEARFPFYQYKGKGQAQGGWSLEHIHAQNSRKLNGSEDYRHWLRDVQPFMTEPAVAIREPKDSQAEVLVTEQSVDLVAAIDALLAKPEIDKTEFETLQEQIFARFGEPNLDTLENLALLTRDINSTLNNGTFPQKRKCIIRLEKDGAFIPVATRNVFLKYYTKEPSHLSYWTAQDREQYRETIYSTLSAYRTN